MIQAVATVVLLGLGTLIMLIAAIGMLRMPDLYMRMQAATKGSALAATLVFLGAFVYFLEPPVVARVLAAIVFLFMTLPIAAHLISRASYLTGVQIWQGTKTGMPDPYEEEPDLVKQTTAEDGETGELHKH